MRSRWEVYKPYNQAIVVALQRFGIRDEADLCTVINRRYELAYTSTCLWHLAEPTLRSQLEQALRKYVRRDPAFESVLREVAQQVKSSLSPDSSKEHECAALLYSMWERADEILRADIESMIQTYTYNNAHRLERFRSIIRAHEQHQRSQLLS